MNLDENGVVTSSLLTKHKIIHGVSTKKLGNMSYDRDTEGLAPKNLEVFMESLSLNLHKSSLIILPVANTSNVAILKQPEKKGRLPIKDSSSLIQDLKRFDRKQGFDACITNARNTYLAILPADCASVMIYDTKSNYYALIHAGKAGVEAAIILKTIIMLLNVSKSEPKNLICYLGPNICKRCYQPDNKQFSLTEGITHQLLMARVPGQNIEVSQFCTHHNEDLFFSNWRAKASKTEGRQIAIIGRK